MKTQLVEIKTLKEDPANVRRHDDRNISAIKKSLNRFGQQKPIVVDARGKVLAGNGTLAAAKALGWKKIAVVRTKLTGDAARGYTVADNRSGELAAWDDAALAALLDEYREKEGGFEALGFTSEEVEELMSRSRLDADLAHFERLGHEAGDDGEAEAGGSGGRADELSLVVTGPREAIDQLRTRINKTREERGVATMAEALLLLITRGPKR